MAPVLAIQDIHNQLKRRKSLPRYFRIHVAGDFLNQDHVECWALLASKWPQIRFLAFTKMHTLDYTVMPENVTVVFSMWPGLPDNAPEGAPRAWMQDGTETRVPNDALECPGKCENCFACWGTTKDVIFHKH